MKNNQLHSFSEHKNEIIPTLQGVYEDTDSA